MPANFLFPPKCARWDVTHSCLSFLISTIRWRQLIMGCDFAAISKFQVLWWTSGSDFLGIVGAHQMGFQGPLDGNWLLLRFFLAFEATPLTSLVLFYHTAFILQNMGWFEDFLMLFFSVCSSLKYSSEMSSVDGYKTDLQLRKGVFWWYLLGMLLGGVAQSQSQFDSILSFAN